MDIDWMEHWIIDLLSDKLVSENSFDEWMWCPERYSENELTMMRLFYNNKKRGYRKHELND